tara:strand:+ start:500 stop:709 length:210 start_codon:yes stop_codon:yes gene_type:complete
MLNNSKLHHIDQEQAKTIKNNEIELLRVVDAMSKGFQLGNDKEQYIIVRKLKKNRQNKSDRSIIVENTI